MSPTGDGEGSVGPDANDGQDVRMWDLIVDVRLEANHGAAGGAEDVGLVWCVVREGGGKLGHAGREDMYWSSRWAKL